MVKIAFLFPGQGSQYVGIGKELCDNFKLARETFDEAEEALQFNISKLCFEGPEEILKLTINAQPAILTVSISALRVLQSETNFSPTLMAGHSLGEYSALVTGGALDFADAVRTVRARGQFMQEAFPVGKGGMAAVLGLERAQVEEICQRAAQGEVLEPANFNSPGQIVISGHMNAIERGIALAEEMGAARAFFLPVSAPFHSPLMKQAGERLARFLENIPINDANVPVVSNVDARPHTSKIEIRELLIQQVSSPVNWAESMQAMFSHKIHKFVEVGPGRVLSGLLRLINRDVFVSHVEDMESLKNVKSIIEEDR